jgi:hypothetical protein
MEAEGAMAPQSKRKPRLKEAGPESAMSSEYLLVVFPQDRAVLADGDKVGVTNHVLMLPANEYEISLDGGGYKPKSQDVILTGTLVVRPKVISFAPA